MRHLQDSLAPIWCVSPSATRLEKNMTRMLSGFALLALASPGLAFAGALPDVIRAPAVAPVGTVNLRALSSNALTRADVTPAHVIAMPPLRFPGTTRPGAALPRVTSPAVTITKVRKAPSKLGFTGIYDGSNSAAIGGELEPPDQGLAANNGTVVEIINNSLQVFDSTGKALSNPVSTATFLRVDSSFGLSDPHVEYDPTTQRWFVEELIYSNTFNGFALAVSSSSDPLGTYIIYKIDDKSSKIRACHGSCFPDYPQVGYDASGFYITGDLFSNTTGQFVSAAIYALPKAVLVAGGPLAYQVFQVPEFVLQPAIPAAPGGYSFEAGGTEYFMTARNIYDGSTNLRVYALSNTFAIGDGTGPLTLSSVDVAAQAYGPTVPSTEPNIVGAYGQSLGATTAPQMDAGYNAFGGGVKYVNGKLVAALATGSTDANGLARDVIAWFTVKPTTDSSGVKAKIASQGYIVAPDGYSLSYPGIALGAKGQGIIGTTITNISAAVPGGLPSAGYISFNPSGGAGKVYTVSGPGGATDDGFTGYFGAGPAGVGRWGDYSSATVDPTTGTLYVGNEYIPDENMYPRGTFANWGTFITEVPMGK